MFDVVSVGELLIDFVEASHAGRSVLFEQYPGGAPANVAVTLARLGRRSAFVGKVGSDQFGDFLRRELKENHVDVTGLVTAKEFNTTLAFVHLDGAGERSFTFYRKPGADMMLTSEDIDYDIVRQSTLFHFGGVSLTRDPARSTILKLDQFSRAHHKMVSFDPNLRLSLWKSEEEAREVIHRGACHANLIKISSEELFFMTGTHEVYEGSRILNERYHARLILVTLGQDGCFYRTAHDTTGIIPSFEVKAMDTTGAGDAFLGGFLASLLDKNPTVGPDFDVSSVSTLESMIRRANAVGALTTKAKGSMSAIPFPDVVRTFMGRDDA